MLKKIVNKSKYKNDYINKLNDKIGLYNQLAENPEKNRSQCLALLQEINYMHMYIMKGMIGDYPNRMVYASICGFKGIGEELKLFGLPSAPGLLADDLLNHCRKSPNSSGLPSLSQWTSSAGGADQSLNSFTEDIKKLNEMKLKLSSPPTMKNADYYYALKAFQNNLLYKLSFDPENNLRQKGTDGLEEDTPTCIKLRELLNQVSNEMVGLQDSLPALQNNQNLIIAQNPLFKELTELSPENRNKLIQRLRSVELDPTDLQTIKKILPSFDENCRIERLEGRNNFNWKITDAQGKSMVVQVGVPPVNQELLSKIEQSTANDFLATPAFFTTSPPDPTHLEVYSLSVFPLYSMGNLRDWREHTLGSSPDVLKHGIDTLSKMTSMCKALSRNGAIYPDIKLSNFFLDDNNRLVTPDKKTVHPLDEKGKAVVFKDNKRKVVGSSGKKSTRIERSEVLEHTAEYAPPELKNALAAKRHWTTPKIDGEALSVYQLGLALYEFIVLPKNSSDWSNNLIFDDAVFKTDSGQRIAKLIRAMTDPNPNNRPSLDTVQSELAQFSTLNAKQESNCSMTRSYSSFLRAFKKDYTDLQEKYGIRDDDERLKQVIFNHIQREIGQFTSEDDLDLKHSILLRTKEYQFLLKNPSKNPNIDYIDDIKNMFDMQKGRRLSGSSAIASDPQDESSRVSSSRLSL